MSFILGTLNPAVEPIVMPAPVTHRTLHKKQSGNLSVNAVATKCQYSVDFSLLTYAEFLVLEGYINATGNETDIELSFTWRDRVHDGATTNLDLNRVLNKVIIDTDSVDIYAIFGSGTSATARQHSVRLTLMEV